MTTAQATYLIQMLTEKGVDFEKGLTDDEVLQAETRFQLQFPPDLKLLLQTALPVSESFVNWRLGLSSEAGAANIMDRLRWPLDGMLFDVRLNDFWVDSWGSLPDSEADRIEIATKYYRTYPVLIPVFSHRYIPGVPNETGNPVFSVYQMDIIYYGYDLACYLAKEFGFILPGEFPVLDKPARIIEFWSEWT